MRKRFIVLIDFSKYSKNLIEYACDWALQENTEIILVHKVSATIPAFTDEKSRDSLLEKANEKALKELRDFADDVIPPLVRVSYYASDKNMREILDELLDQSFDQLILTGLKQKTTFEKLFIKSTILETIANTDHVVVAIPESIKDHSHENVYVAVSEKYEINLFEFNRLLSFINKKDAKIIFFHLAKPGEDNTEVEKQLIELTQLFGKDYKTFYEIYITDHPQNNIKSVINNKVKEILVVQKGSRMMTDHLFRKFLINDMVHKAETPLIVLP